MFVNSVPKEKLVEELGRAVDKVMKGALVSDDLVVGRQAEIEKDVRLVGVDAACIAEAVQCGVLPSVEVDGLKFCSVESLAAFCFRVYETANNEREWGRCCSKFDTGAATTPQCEAFVPACALSPYVDAAQCESCAE